MEPYITTLLTAVAGYLIGSLSFARLIIRIFAPQKEVREIEVGIPGTGVAFRSEAVSATTVNLQLGPRYGCLTGILDILKVAAPALFLKRYWHQSYLYLIFAGMATLGHNWPLYYGFRGGRGMSPILGGLLVVDWIGTTLTTGVSMVFGTALQSFYLANKLIVLLMIPWLWLRHRDWRLVAYAAAMNLLNWLAGIPEAREMIRLRRDGTLTDFLTARRVRSIGSDNDREEERLTFYGILASAISRLRRDKRQPD